MRDEIAGRLPMQRHGEVGEIAAAAMWLVSDASLFYDGGDRAGGWGRNLHAQPSKLGVRFAKEQDEWHRG